jgi:hypothetical protein
MKIHGSPSEASRKLVVTVISRMIGWARIVKTPSSQARIQSLA